MLVETTFIFPFSKWRRRLFFPSASGDDAYFSLQQVETTVIFPFSANSTRK